MKKYILLVFIALSRLHGGVFDRLYIGAGGGVIQTRGLEYSYGDVRDFYPPGKFDTPGQQSFLKENGTQIYKVVAKQRAKTGSFILGYKLLKYFNIESEYLQTGEIRTDIKYNFALLPPLFFDPIGPAAFKRGEKHEFSFTSLTGRLNVPIIGGLAVSGAVGVTRTNDRYTGLYNLLRQGDEGGVLSNEHYYGPRFSAGLSYGIASHALVRIDWSRYNYRGHFVYPHPTIDSLSLQLQFRL